MLDKFFDLGKEILMLGKSWYVQILKLGKVIENIIFHFSFLKGDPQRGPKYIYKMCAYGNVNNNQRFMHNNICVSNNWNFNM